MIDVRTFYCLDCKKHFLVTKDDWDKYLKQKHEQFIQNYMDWVNGRPRIFKEGEIPLCGHIRWVCEYLLFDDGQNKGAEIRRQNND